MGLGMGLGSCVQPRVRIRVRPRETSTSRHAFPRMHAMLNVVGRGFAMSPCAAQPGESEQKVPRARGFEWPLVHAKVHAHLRY
jgi:hypothetical protein